MENFFTILFVVGFLLVIFVVYFYRKDKKRILPLSEQVYQDARLVVSIVKEKSSARQIILEVFFKKENVTLKDFMVELLAKDKSKKGVSFSSIFPENNRPKIFQDNNKFYTGVPYSDLKKALSFKDFPYESLRFVAETTEGKKYKSHQMVLSGRWGLVRMDSGIYN